ncbi:STAS domain-containing protein [Desulfogranum marinum]|jgi:anti-sigma B factor antagonist|uniref:STAS domain-containing protein n=1 Tax=Desulfogranum marinum TaxID=453220 RepID=UPI00196310FE|nr:STAS domain-containing protein [Desulfogranum marinum]MBM9511234.1 STAS domain-containing protein [Desulfogranum marinum]
MDIVCDKRAGGTLLQVNGRMDAVYAPAFEKECLLVIDGGEIKVVVDLTGLEYISSAGLRSILVSAKKAKVKGCSIQFCGVSGMVEEVFKISGLFTLFSIVPTVEEAFAA